MHRHWSDVAVRSTTKSMDREQRTVQLEGTTLWNFPMKLISKVENCVSAMPTRTRKRKVVLVEVELLKIMIMEVGVDDVEEID